MTRLFKDLTSFRKDRVTAVYLSGRLLQWCSVIQGNEGVKKTSAGQLELPAVGDEVDAEVYKAALGEARTQAAKEGLAGKVAIGMDSSQLLLRVITLPDVPEEELASMVQLQVDKFSPFPVETMVFSHELLEKKEDKCRLLVVAVKDEIVRGLGDLLKPIGLITKRVDAAVMGWVQLLKDAGHIRTEGRQAVILIDGTAIPELVVFNNGMPLLFRLVSEVEGLTGAEYAAEAARAFGYTMMSLEMEHGSEPYNVQLWTRGIDAEDVAGKIRAECSCEVYSSSLDELGLLAEGIARRSTFPSALNLIPAAWQAETDAALFKKKAIIGFAAAFGVWALVALAIFGGSFWQEKRLAHYKAVQLEWRQKAKDVGDMRRRVVTVKRYLDNSHSALECLREITVALPAGVSLTSFTYKRADRIKISGEASASSDVYEFKNKIDASKLFAGSTLNGPRRDVKRGRELFELELKLPGGGTEQ